MSIDRNMSQKLQALHQEAREMPGAATDCLEWPLRQPLKLLFVGAFPPPDRRVFGGNVRDCALLLNSAFARRFVLIPLDTTQVSNPPPNVAIRAFFACRRMWSYLRILINERPDAVCLFAATGGSVVEKSLMALIARAFGARSLLFPRAGALIDSARRSPLHRLIYKTLFHTATHMLCMGPAWQEFATREMGFSRDRAPIVPSWSATKELLAIGRGRLEDWGASLRPLRVLFLGWVEEAKGVMDLVRACHTLKRSGVDFTLVIAGRGRAEAAIREQIDRLDIAQNVSLVGWVQGDELMALWRNSDVLALPSRAEGFPNVVIEAMAAGVAVVTTPVGLIPDFVHHRVHGILCEPGDDQSLAESLELMAIDPHLRRSLVENAYSLSREVFGSEVAASRFADVIEAAVIAR